MRHLLISREYPPAAAGGIGTYTANIARLLAEAGETVHVIGQRWAGADIARQETMGGRLIVHRVAYDDWNALLGARPHAAMTSNIARQLFRSSLQAQAFAWEAALLAEQVVEQEAIDVIEAQEYEAPLYFFAMRRALAMGPARTPPFIIHLHSPTEFIARHNEWDPAAPQTLLATRLERATFEAADALLCPSAYLARSVESRSGLDAGAVKVIPLPFGGEAEAVRSAETWRSGSILYIGRLERRKGVLEWIDAAVQVAFARQEITFEFVGENVLGTRRHSGETILNRRIPRELRPRFRFHGHGTRDEVKARLAGARMVVVPSRWENFPYTCVEAMASGVPVLASPEGGMAEMIEDGRTGWISSAATPEALGAALERALAQPPDALAAMGSAAAASIREQCDPARIVYQHLEFKTSVRDRGAHRSASVQTPVQTARGIACIIVDWSDDAAMERTLRSLAAQTTAPAAVVVALAPGSDVPARSTFIQIDGEARESWQYHEVAEHRSPATKNRAAAFAASLVRETSGTAPLGIAFIEPGLELRPHFVETFARSLEAQKGTGIVSGWTLHPDGTLHAPPQPSFPHQFLHNDVGPAAVMRSSAFEEVSGFAEDIADGLEDWDLTNRIMARGWRAVTVPLLVATGDVEHSTYDFIGLSPQHALLERLPGVMAQHAQELAILAAAAIARGSEDAAPWAPPTLRDVLGFAVRHPVQTAVRFRERIATLMTMRAADRRAARNEDADGNT
jgi:glycosyltransferase involved in cell wall biosynthesis